MAKIVILGAGTWGSALSIMLAREGHDLTLWSAIAEELVQMSQSKKHKNLPGAILPDTLKTQPDLKKALEKKDLVVFAVPSIFIRETARKVSQVFARQKGGVSEARPLILCVSKGIEKDTNEILTKVIQEELEKDGNGSFSYIAVSGPTHAEEVAIGLPSCLVAASPDLAKAETVQKIFMNERMRVYTNPDMIGVELCGALKNIIALAAGMSDGSGFGDNAKAALITRGAAEMTRLGLAMGGSAETFAGLAGIGDLIVTATSLHSRNYRCGYYLGQGKTLEEALQEVGQVVEGLNALPAALALKEKYKVQMPIVDGVQAVVNQGVPVREAVLSLMNRDPKSEIR